MITDKNTMLAFTIQKDLEGINVLSLNGYISDDKFNRLMGKIENDLLDLLEKVENIVR